MATTVQITDRGKTAKIRNPWAVAGLSFITFGIYYLVWYFKINREMADWGEQNKVDIGTSPGMSVIAITLGAFLSHLLDSSRSGRPVSECSSPSAPRMFTVAVGFCGSCCT